MKNDDYSYDALGRRITQIESGTTTNLYYSSSDQVVEEQQDGAETQQYVWSPFYVNSLIERDTAQAFSTPTLDTTFGYSHHPRRRWWLRLGTPSPNPHRARITLRCMRPVPWMPGISWWR